MQVAVAAKCMRRARQCRKQFSGDRDHLVKCLMESAESVIKECAAEKGDF